MDKAKWIPVKDRAPEIDCLTIDTEGQIELARSITAATLKTEQGEEVVYLANDHGFLLDFYKIIVPESDRLVACTHITHWMPLPEPPKT